MKDTRWGGRKEEEGWGSVTRQVEGRLKNDEGVQRTVRVKERIKERDVFLERPRRSCE